MGSVFPTLGFDKQKTTLRIARVIFSRYLLSQEIEVKGTGHSSCAMSRSNAGAVASLVFLELVRDRKSGCLAEFPDPFPLTVIQAGAMAVVGIEAQ